MLGIESFSQVICFTKIEATSLVYCNISKHKLFYRLSNQFAFFSSNLYFNNLKSQMNMYIMNRYDDTSLEVILDGFNFFELIWYFVIINFLTFPQLVVISFNFVF